MDGSIPPSRHGRRRDWSSLPELAIFEVATRLNPIEFASFAGVCKSWRTICNQNKTQIHAHHPPILLLLDCNRDHNLFDRKTPLCEVYSFPDKRLYSKPLPPCFLITDSHHYGCCHGYILVGAIPPCYKEEESGRPILDVHLLNPFTEGLISMPAPAPFTVDKAVLTAPPHSPGSLVVALSWGTRHLMVCRPGVDDHWSAVPFAAFMQKELLDLPGFLFQVVFYKGCVYVLTNKAVFGIKIEVEPEVSVRQLEHFYVGDPNSSVISEYSPFCLVAGDEELFTLRLKLSDRTLFNRVYRLQDGKKGMWEKVEDVGGRTLFVTDCSGFVGSGTRLAGYEEGWDDRVFFANPFCTVEINGAGGTLLEATNLHVNFLWRLWFGFLRAISNDSDAFLSLQIK